MRRFKITFEVYEIDQTESPFEKQQIVMEI